MTASEKSKSQSLKDKINGVKVKVVTVSRGTNQKTLMQFLFNIIVDFSDLPSRIMLSINQSLMFKWRINDKPKYEEKIQAKLKS